MTSTVQAFIIRFRIFLFDFGGIHTLFPLRIPQILNASYALSAIKFLLRRKFLSINLEAAFTSCVWPGVMQKSIGSASSLQSSGGTILACRSKTRFWAGKTWVKKTDREYSLRQSIFAHIGVGEGKFRKVVIGKNGITWGKMMNFRPNGMCLDRFVQAQSNGVYERALVEIKAGRKRSHWMWFVFPQVAGLGFSSTSQYYGIKGLTEAKEYLAHPVLGPRLREITHALLDLPNPDPEKIFGYPDDLKLHSSLTLFDFVSPREIFADALAKCFGGERDGETVRIVADCN